VPESGVEFMAPISGAVFWSVCQGPKASLSETMLCVDNVINAVLLLTSETQLYDESLSVTVSRCAAYLCFIRHGPDSILVIYQDTWGIHTATFCSAWYCTPHSHYFAKFSQ